MAFKVYNDVGETASQSSTGVLSCDGALANHQLFSSEYNDRQEFFYYLEKGSDWQLGQAYYDLDLNQIHLLYFFESSTDAALDLSSGSMSIYAVVEQQDRPVSTKGSFTAQRGGASKNIIKLRAHDQLVDSTDYAELELDDEQLQAGNALSRTGNHVVIAEDGIYMYGFAGMFQDNLDISTDVYPTLLFQYSDDNGSSWNDIAARAGDTLHNYGSMFLGSFDALEVTGAETTNWRIRAQVKQALGGDFKCDDCDLTVWKQWD